ncbi:acyl-CoA thioesterase [Halovivax gelatinilyticus]|uniref:acyl-CoA thioesterase n=1 Tax=Halovivax gelatinilyticus TaxID=2961597 RepID=UPI0020CA3D50|nr:thioesterase family protein [Halovivax gelatinilyticus]
MADDSGETTAQYDGTDDAYLSVFENRVRLAETDLQGIVFYGTYVTYQDESVAAYRRKIGFGGEYIETADWTTRVVSTEMNYRASAAYEDVLENEIRVSRIGNSSVTYDYRVGRKRDGTRLAEGTVTQVVIDKETTRPTRVPDAFREAVADVQRR